MPQLADLSSALRAEANRLLAAIPNGQFPLPKGMTRAQASAAVADWHRFVDKHQLACVAVFRDDFNKLWLRDQNGDLHECIEEFEP